MCASVSKTVIELKRVQIGLLKLDEGFAEGEYRALTDEELELLRWLSTFIVFIVAEVTLK